MKRLAAAAFAAMLVAVSMIAAPAQPADALGLLFRGLAKIGTKVDDAARVGRNLDEVASLSGVPRAARANMTPAQVLEWERAYAELTKAAERAQIDQASTLFFQDRARFSRLIPLGDDAPHLRLRVLGDEAFDPALLAFARSRFRWMAEQPFDAANLKVVSLGMADDSAASAVELGKFRRTIPSANRDEVGGLNRIGENGLTEADMIRTLTPYRGKTVVVVGHVPTGQADFIVHAASGEARSVNIQAWLEAARKAEVTFIPIGCNSERIGQFGAIGILNTTRVRNRLREVIRAAPATFGDFLKVLGGDDLSFAFNAVDPRLFSSGVGIVERQGDGTVGHLIYSGGNVGRQAVSARQQLPTDPCFAATDGRAFDSCVGGHFAAAYAQETERIVGCRKGELALAQTRLETSGAQLQDHERNRPLILAGYALALLLAGYLMVNGKQAHMLEQEYGPAVKHVFGRNALLDVLDTAKAGVRRAFASFDWVLAAALFALLAALPFLAAQINIFWVIGGLAAVFGLIGMITLLDSARSERSLVSLFAAISGLAVLGSGFLVYQSFTGAESARTEIAAAEAKRADFLREDPSASWRQGCAGQWRPSSPLLEGLPPPAIS
ncbi:MAG TPA: hypothetical protein VGB54_05240 [Allosphingosinicella sp.]